MAHKFTFIVGSVAPQNEGNDEYNCGVCATRIPGRPRWGFQYNYETGRIISQRGTYDFDDHGEVVVCGKCEPKFHPDTILEV
jgi:hypothetical protein